MSESVKATYLHDGYKPSRGLTGWYRDLTVKEAKEKGYRNPLYAVDRNGCVREVRVNGQAKTWKRSPGCILSLKYGLRDCFHVGHKDRAENQAIQCYGSVRIVVAVTGMEFKKETPPEIVTDYVKEQLGI